MWGLLPSWLGDPVLSASCLRICLGIGKSCRHQCVGPGIWAVGIWNKSWWAACIHGINSIWLFNVHVRSVVGSLPRPGACHVQPHVFTIASRISIALRSRGNGSSISTTWFAVQVPMWRVLNVWNLDCRPT